MALTLPAGLEMTEAWIVGSGQSLGSVTNLWVTWVRNYIAEFQLPPPTPFPVSITYSSQGIVLLSRILIYIMVISLASVWGWKSLLSSQAFFRDVTWWSSALFILAKRDPASSSVNSLKQNFCLEPDHLACEELEPTGSFLHLTVLVTCSPAQVFSRWGRTARPTLSGRGWSAELRCCPQPCPRGLLGPRSPVSPQGEKKQASCFKFFKSY